MRRSTLAFLSTILPAALGAQGWIVPPPCRMDRCPPPTQRIERVASDVRVELRDRVLRYEVEETFVNRGGGLGEADYIFPMPKGAAFQDLKLEVNGELVSGEIMAAPQARRIYEEIVRGQRDPALVEWMGHGLLRTRIFPLNPNERKRVVVRFQTVAEREGDAMRVDYFRPRTPGGGGDARPMPVRDGRDRDARDVRVTESSFTLTYPADDEYGRAYSPTHSLRTRESGGRRVVEASGDAREMTILLPIRRRSEAAVSVLTHAPGREDGFALITLSPPQVAPRRTPRDVTVVIDVSGSMSGRKMEQAKAAGRQLLGTLDAGDRFRFIDFSTDVRTFRDDWSPVTRANVAAAERYLDALEANGSTNISGALDEALRGDAASGRLSVVLFLTDGEPTVGERDPSAIARRAARLRADRRVFSFGVGADVNVPLIEQLALEGQGTAQFVRPDESVERAVGLVASRIVNPVVTDLRLRADGVRLTKVSPAGPYDLFAGQDLVVLARYEGSGDATLSFEGTTASGPVRWRARASFPERSRENPYVGRLWATQRIGWLSAERRRNGASPELDDEIRALGERFGIPTEFTSYLVVEPGMRRVATGVGAVQGRAANAPPVAAPVDVQSSMPADMASAGARARQDSLGVANRARDAMRSAPPPAAFDAAKSAAGQRAATSIAAVDSLAREESVRSGDGRAATRRVGARTFTLRSGVWTDAGRRDGLRVVRIKAFGTAYFALLDLIPELREVLALGDRVTVAGKGVVLESGPDGADRLSPAELAAVGRDW